jgi:4-amino-4-deoxy-L-arabinose transferase-like glycosyltransferase
MRALTRLPPHFHPGVGTLSRNVGEGLKYVRLDSKHLSRAPGAWWVRVPPRAWSCLPPYALLVLLCMVLYAPGLATIPPLDRDEARFAQATRQMLETGDHVRIRFQGEARNKKPVGIHWLQAAAVAAFSAAENPAIWPYRLPSALAATIAVLLTFGLGNRLWNSQLAGFIAAVFIGSALGVVIEAHLAKTDAVLLAAIVVAQGALGLVYVGAGGGRRIGWQVPVVFWLAEAVAVLLKGPPGPVLALLTAGCLAIADRDVRWIRALRPLSGLTGFAVIVAPWLIAVQNATGGHFLSDSLGHDLLPKLVGAQESHGAPPGYYLAVALAGFWPGSLSLIPGWVWGWRQRHDAVGRFLLAWLVPGWLFIELVPTKLPHYVLPLYPALALLVGGALAHGFGKLPDSRARLADATLRVIWGAVTVALAAALVLLPQWFGGPVSAAAVAAVAVMLGLALLLLLVDMQPIRAALLSAALAVSFTVPAALVVVPGLDALWLSRSAAAALARHPPGPGEVVLSVGYSEPSLVFLLGTATRLVTAQPGDEQLAGASLALVNTRDDAEFRQSLARRGVAVRRVDQVEGVDYSAGGGRLVLTLYRLEPR